MTDVPLMQDNEFVPFHSQSIIAFDQQEKIIAVALPAIPFDKNFGVYCENFLATYYHAVIGSFVPLYETAYDRFLSTILTGASQTIISAILGPNRLSTHYLDRAHLTADLELRTAYELLEALNLSADRPVVVGHGANGLLAKALPFSEDPWRVSFEGPMLDDSPMVALAHDNPDTSRIINFYTVGSFYALSDAEALINNKIPSHGANHLIPEGPFETFCFVAAACGSDIRFDRLCNDVLGEEQFAQIWNIVGRARDRPSSEKTA
jgi:hypothetical protein